MTEIQQRYKRLLKELRKCEKLNNSKSYFLAQAVHDLRQPIQALILFTEVLKDTPLNEEQKNLAEKIHNSTIEIKELLTNYLDLSKLNEGGVIYEPRHFKLKPLTDKLADNYAIICKDKNKHFNYQTCNADIFSDPILVERILQNLLSNAVKEETWVQMKDDLTRLTTDFTNINIIGSGGNINKLYRLAEKKDKKLQRMSVESLQALYDELNPLTPEQRMKQFGLKADRADVIVPAAKIFLSIADVVKAGYIHVPVIGLADGIIDNLYAGNQLDS